MEEDDDTQSHTISLTTPPPNPNPNPNTNPKPKPKPISSSSSQSPSRNNALALVVHTPTVTPTTTTTTRIGGGRDDCWSEEATKVLIEAWGDRFSEPGKGTLKQQQWKQVAEIVNDSGQCKYPKTDIQCKNRIDTVKKKYKQEKAKLASGGDGADSKWVFFKKLESLIGGGVANCVTNNSSSTRRRGVMNSRFNRGGGTQVVQSGEVKKNSDSMRWHFRKRSASETESESEDDGSNDSGESLPPLQPVPPQPVSFQLPKRMKVDRNGGGVGVVGGGGVGEVAKAILGFTEAYEKAETAKLKLMMDLEKERMKFAKEMEVQRMQFLKTQMEISSQYNNQEEEEEEWNNNNNRRGGERRNVVDDDDDEDDRHVKNNGDVSS